MFNMRIAGLAALLMLSGMVVGCDKKVKLTFVNATEQEREIILSSPSTGSQRVGIVPPDGGKLIYTVKVPKDELPATCAWKAGDKEGAFSMDKKTKGSQTVYIGPAGMVAPARKGAQPSPKAAEEVNPSANGPGAVIE